MAAHMGHLPDTFAIFLKEMGVQTKQIKNTTQDIVKMMKTHTLIMFKTYWKSTKESVILLECGDTDTEEDLNKEDNEEQQDGSDAMVRTTNDWYKWLAQKETDHFTSDDDTDIMSNSTQDNDLDDNDHHTNSGGGLSFAPH